MYDTVSLSLIWPWLYLFTLQCHGSVVPIYSCMEKRTLPEFTKTALVALGICVFFYTSIASFGYLTFGADVNQDILLSYEPTADVLVAVILIAVKMYTSYPIFCFVGRLANVLCLNESYSVPLIMNYALFLHKILTRMYKYEWPTTCNGQTVWYFIIILIKMPFYQVLHFFWDALYSGVCYHTKWQNHYMED